MKTKVFYLIVMAVLPAWLAAKDIIVKSKIDKVTVYTAKAQVFRTSGFTAEPGINTVIFDGVSPQINSNSIQASGEGNFIILDVKFRIKYPDPVLPVETELPPKVQRDIALLEDSLAFIGFEYDGITNQITILNQQKKMIENNKLINGGSDTIPEIKEAMIYYQTKLFEINKKIMEINKEQYKAKQKKTRMENRLASLKAYNSKVNQEKPEEPKYQVLVTISAETAVTGKIKVNYMVNNAGWTSLYDIRATDISKPVQLIQKANVYQNTGEEWTNAKLTLSTINPNTNLYVPRLYAQYLNYYVYNTMPASYSGGSVAQTASLDYSKAKEMKDEISDLEAYTPIDFTQAQQTLTNVEYEISLPYTIPSDGENHMIAIQDIKLKSDFQYYIVPKIDKNAYLVARVSDFGQYDLLPGKANIFFNGGFIGETNINTSAINDTMEIVLGVDRSIQIERELKKSETRNVLVGSNQINTICYETKIKNNKLSNVKIVLTDQVPLSVQKDIIVKPIENKGADYDETTGFVTWKTTLKPSDTKTFSFSYTVESDKNKPLANLY